MNCAITTDSIKESVECLHQGGVIIFPTETVYGIGACSYFHDSCRKIYQIKNRPSDNPLIVHVANIEHLQKIALVQKDFLYLIKKFSPGPISYILPKKDSRVFSTGFSTIGVRIPQNETALLLLEEFGKPISAPSANLSGKPSITSFQRAEQIFSNKVDLILKGKISKIGLESTILDLSGKVPLYLREGFFSFEQIQEYLPNLQKNSKLSKNPSPGLKYKHYSPNCKVTLINDLPEYPNPKQARIGYKIKNMGNFDKQILNNEDYMQSLYEFFMFCEQNHIQEIFCEKPKSGIGKDALIDRISRASES